MPKVTRKITVSCCVKEYPTIFYEDDSPLFCKFCCHSVNLKSSTIKDHLQSKSHKNKRDVQERSAPVLRQVTLPTVQKSRSKFVTEFVKMCLASNIPLEKVDKMTPWIKKINPQGGALSSADNLRTYYIPKVNLNNPGFSSDIEFLNE